MFLLFFKRNTKLKKFKEVVGIFEHITSTILLKRLNKPTAVFDQLKQVKGIQEIRNRDFFIIVLVIQACT